MDLIGAIAFVTLVSDENLPMLGDASRGAYIPGKMHRDRKNRMEFRDSSVVDAINPQQPGDDRNIPLIGWDKPRIVGFPATSQHFFCGATVIGQCGFGEILPPVGLKVRYDLAGI